MNTATPTGRRHVGTVLLSITAAVLVWSGIGPHDRTTWWLEVAPALMGAPILMATHRRARLSTLVYVLLTFHGVLLMIGGHYTYANVPIGNWFRDALDLDRNHYDRFCHFIQGFVPAILAREILLRTSPLVRGRWLFVIVTAICLAFSAFYEFIEWWAALIGGQGAESFLGTQGDQWDTQWDMFLAFVGAMTAQAMLGRVHDRSMERP